MQQVSCEQKLPNNKFCCLNFCRYVPGKALTNPKIWLINCWHTGIDQFLYVNRINEGPQKYDWSIVDMQKGGDGGGSKLVSASGQAGSPGISPPFPPFTCPSFYSILLTKLTHYPVFCFYFSACWTLLYFYHHMSQIISYLKKKAMFRLKMLLQHRQTVTIALQLLLAHQPNVAKTRVFNMNQKSEGPDKFSKMLFFSKF